MKNKNDEIFDQLSNSKRKRTQRREEVAREKRRNKRNKIIGFLVTFCIVAVLALGVGTSIYYTATATVASSDYSALLTDDGHFSNLTVTDYIKELEYNGIQVALADVEFTDEEVESSITSTLANYKEASTDSSLEIADGDTVNIDYVGTVNGDAFEGGDTKGAGTDLVIGSGTYVDTFEQQLIGKKPGDTVTVSVTFPEDYSTTELAGMDATFEVVINSITVTPEFTDEFVAANLSEYATTTEEYKTYLKTTNYDTKLSTFLKNYLSSNSSVTSVPKENLKHMKSIIRYEDESTYNSYNELYISLMGSAAYNSFSDYTGKSQREYEKSLIDSATDRLAIDFVYQWIFDKEALSITEEEYNAYVETIGEETSTRYGKAYTYQLMMKDKVIEYLKTTAIVE
ncbi:MAG: FKBP-type peptidyl-prolyl cis-trans isomerase [Lachnospiraceae bacterium]